MLRRILAVGLSLALVAGVFAGCGSKGTSKDEGAANGKYKDGIYFAQQKSFDEKTGYKYMVTLEVSDGKITKADWNGASVNAGEDKKTLSKTGKYGMKEKGKSIAEWHEQAEKVEKFLVDKQDPAAITLKDDEGHTDAVSGATIKVKEFVELAKEALEKGPVGRGKYKDGPYRAEAKDFDAKSGWKETVDLTVVNGYIVAANWNGVHKDGGDDKKKQSVDGKYGMKEKGGAIAEWHEQAAKAEAYLLEKQDPTDIKYKDEEGRSDAISGATIHVKGFFDLAQEALANAK